MSSPLNSPSTPEMHAGQSTSPFSMGSHKGGMDGMIHPEGGIKTEQGMMGLNSANSDARSDISNDSLDHRMRMTGYHDEIKSEMATVTA